MEGFENNSTQENFIADVIGDEVVEDIGNDCLVSEEESDYEYQDDAGEVDEWMPNRHRKQLVRDRLVNSLDKCFRIENFDEFKLPTEPKEYLYKPRSSQPVVWQNNWSINDMERILCTGEVLGEASQAVTPLQSWKLFISDHMIDEIVRNTNVRIQNVIDQLSEKEVPKKDTVHVRKTDSVEMRSFLGLLYARGLLGLNTHDQKILFREKIGHPIFGAVMSCHRFAFLHAHITFDDLTTRPQRWEHDRFAAVRDLFETFNEHCSSVLQPDDFLTIDETLYACRTQIGFKMYNRSKPVRYGLLYKSINAVRFPFTFRTLVYSGKPKGEPSPHYIRGTLPTVKALVNQLSSSVNLQGMTISLDRLYTSLDLFEWLMTKGITALGTLDHCRKGIPPQIKSVIGREEKSYEVYREKSQGKMYLNSYVKQTKSKGLRNILLLSTLPPLLGVTKDDKQKKPAIYKLYDFTKGGTDIIDQRINFYTVHTKSRKWTINAFSYILDTARVNSQTVYCKNTNQNPRSLNSFSFGWELVLSLCIPQILKRKETPGLQQSTLAKIKIMLDGCEPDLDVEDVPQCHNVRAEKRARCTTCLESIRGPGYKNSYSKVKRSKLQCKICKNTTCEQHLQHLCSNCYAKLKP